MTPTWAMPRALPPPKATPTVGSPCASGDRRDARLAGRWGSCGRALQWRRARRRHERHDQPANPDAPRRMSGQHPCLMLADLRAPPFHAWRRARETHGVPQLVLGNINGRLQASTLARYGFPFHAFKNPESRQAWTHAGKLDPTPPLARRARLTTPNDQSSVASTRFGGPTGGLPSAAICHKMLAVLLTCPAEIS